MKNILLTILFYILLYSFAFGQNFDIYVSDGGNFNNPPWQILKFDEDGNNPDVYIDEQLSWPQDIVFLEDQNVALISNLNTGVITKYNAGNGSYIDNFATGIDGPTRMKIGGDNLLYVLQWGTNGKVLRYELDGTFVDEFTNTGVTQSIGLDWDSNGNLYVSSYGSNFVRMYDSDGVDQGNFISSGLQGPTNIWFEDSGDLLVNNWNGTTVRRFDSNGNFIEDFITGLSNPEGVAMFPNGNILIGNGGTSAVKLFDSNGNFIEDIIASGTANLLLPNAVVLREKEALAVKEITEKTGFLVSNFGNAFYLKDEFLDKIDQVEVFDITGNLLGKRIIEGKLAWEASDVMGGMYVIKALSSDKKVFIQRIVVTKRQ